MDGVRPKPIGRDWFCKFKVVLSGFCDYVGAELKKILGGHSEVSGEPNCMFIHARFAYKILVEK